ncbi:Der GTPase-activating protein YihI [Aliidiomarina sp. Khilg15.8]
MTRQKKTRKPGPLGAKSQPKTQREHQEPASGKRPARVKGKPAGSRHNVQQDNKTVSKNERSGDPRVGSKRKIDLVAPEAKPEKAPLTPQQELEQLENNERLQALLAKLENGDELSRQDKVWVDEKLDRYQTLATELGLDDEDDLDEEDDEDDLEPWQKFENPKDWL